MICRDQTHVWLYCDDQTLPTVIRYSLCHQTNYFRLTVFIQPNTAPLAFQTPVKPFFPPSARHFPPHHLPASPNLTFLTIQITHFNNSVKFKLLLCSWRTLCALCLALFKGSEGDDGNGDVGCTGHLMSLHIGQSIHVMQDAQDNAASRV